MKTLNDLRAIPEGARNYTDKQEWLDSVKDLELRYWGNGSINAYTNAGDSQLVGKDYTSVIAAWFDVRDCRAKAYGWKKCQTPEAIYTFEIKPSSIAYEVNIPFVLELDEEAAIVLENELHSAIEAVLKKYWRL
jgi:hypothetical protein